MLEFWPILSDIFDRRIVLMVCALTPFVLVLLLWFINIDNFRTFLIIIFLYGGISVPIYSLCISYANDFLSPNQMTGAAGALNLFQSFGMILGPPLASLSIFLFGLGAFLPTVAIFHLILGLFALWRMSQRAPIPQEAQSGYIPVPIRSSSLIVELSPEVKSDEKEN